MKRLLVSLDEETYEALRRLAFEKNAPMARLVRHAIEKTFEDELDGIIGEMALAEYLKDPSGAVSLDELLEEYGIAVPGRRPSKGKTRVRKPAS
jgi:predicted DNA-binding protein